MKRTTPPVLLLCAVLLLAVRPRIRGLEAYFLDVGQGDAVFFHSGTTAALMDCGSSQYKSVGKNRLVPFLKSRGIRKLDYIFVSHGDSDHINGLVWMLENEEKIQVEHIIMPAPGRDGEVYREIEALGRTRGAKISYMEAGKSLQEEELQITAVHPAKDTFYEDRNSHSLVLSVRYRDFSMLLTGDIDQKGERRIMEWEDLKAKEEQVIPGNLSVLKAAHHGSATSTGRELLERVNPAITILSYGRGNSYGHPSKEVVKRLEEAGTGIWSTEVSGAVHIKTDGRKMKAEGFLLDKNRGLGL